MSRTRRKKRPGEADNYPTPEWAIERFFESWLEVAPLGRLGGRWIEPAAGDGVIIDVARRFVPKVSWTAVDVRDTRPALARVGADRIFVEDFLRWEPDGRYDVAIMNPPFRLAFEFVEKCLSFCELVACFQTLNFLGSSDRNAWMREHVPATYVLPDRVSHVGEGKTDAVYSAWYVWQPEPTTVQTIKVLTSTPLDVRKAALSRSASAVDVHSVALDSLFYEVGR